jgi:hypothetical protein
MQQEQTFSKKRKPWVSLEIREVGKLAETILQGGGKITAAGGDPGEPLKQQPTG